MDVHFNAYKIKYDTMMTFLKPILNSHKIHQVNLFINIDDVFHNLHKPLVNNEFQVIGVNADKQMISNVLNLCAHYKNWFTRQGIRCRIIGVYTSSISGFKNNLYTLLYRKKYIDINDPVNSMYFFINQAIRNSLHLLKVMTNYINNVFLIDSKYIEPSAVPYFISQEENFKSDWNILITRDLYDLQYSYLDKWSYLSPKGDNTQYITKANLWDYISDHEKVGFYLQNQIPVSIYPVVLAIVGDKYRNIPRLKRIGWKTMFQYIDSMTNSSWESDALFQTEFLKIMSKKQITEEIFNDNLSSVSIDWQVMKLGEIDRNVLTEQLINIPDFENLSILVDRYFRKFPINIYSLNQDPSNNKNPFNL